MKKLLAVKRSGVVCAAAVVILCGAGGAAAVFAGRAAKAAAPNDPTAALSTLAGSSAAAVARQNAGQASPPAAASSVPQSKSLTKENSGCWPWPDSMDGVKADPQNHTVLYEDANVRFLDVHTPARTINTKHDHQWLSVFLQEEAQPLGQDHGTNGAAGTPGGVVPADAHFPLLNIAGTQAPHAFENLDNFNKHFYRAEMKKIPFECPPPNGAMTSYNKERMTTLPAAPGDERNYPDSMDAIVTAQQTDVVRFENFDIRLVEVTIGPGKKQQMGAQLYPSVLIFYQRQPRGIMTLADGKTVVVGAKFDGAKFPQAIREGKQPPHAFENTDTIPAHYYRVEFKKIDYKG